MKKVFCFDNGGPRRALHAMAIAEDGTILAEHYCTDESFMKHDLGFTSNWQHEHYDAHYGAGNWELEWVGAEEAPTHRGLQGALVLNITRRQEPKP